MEKEKTSKKGAWRQYLGMLFALLMGMVGGLLIAQYLLAMPDLPAWRKFLDLGLLLVMLYVAIFLQFIIHEAGHLVFGLLTGYQYSSFRVGSFMWVKRDNKICLKRMSIAGTGGQCLMCPPDMIDGKIPYVLYNLGGCITNIISGVIAFGLSMLCGDIPFLSISLQLIGMVGFAFALMNGVPMRLGIVNNDGHNALSLGKIPEALKSFWVMMKINAEVTKGARLKDLPEEWFEVPTDEGMKNAITAVMGVSASNRLMDEHRFVEAAELMDKLLSMDSAIVGLNHSMLTCDRIYCELICENRKELVDKLLDAQQQKIMKQMNKFLTVIRTEFTYALIVEKDTDKASRLKEQFELRAKTYPSQSDIDSECELIQIAESIGESKMRKEVESEC